MSNAHVARPPVFVADEPSVLRHEPRSSLGFRKFVHRGRCLVSVSLLAIWTAQAFPQVSDGLTA